MELVILETQTSLRSAFPYLTEILQIHAKKHLLVIGLKMKLLWTNMLFMGSFVFIANLLCKLHQLIPFLNDTLREVFANENAASGEHLCLLKNLISILGQNRR